MKTNKLYVLFIQNIHTISFLTIISETILTKCPESKVHQIVREISEQLKRMSQLSTRAELRAERQLHGCTSRSL